MSIWGNDNDYINEDFNNENSLVEMFLVDDISRLDSDVIQEFCNSYEAQELMEANVLKKKTIVRLSKKDDKTRRTKIAAFELAKENNDPNWALLCKNRIKEKELINKIMTRWGTKAEKNAVKAQKEYIKTAGKTTDNFKKMGGSNR